jgi:hypothetical protein
VQIECSRRGDQYWDSVKPVPPREHFWVRVVERRLPISRRLIGRHDEKRRDVDIDTDEVERKRRGHVRGRSYLRARASHRADRLNRQAVREDRVVAHLIQRPVRERQTRSDVHPDGLALDVQFNSPVPLCRDLAELVDREEMSDSVAQLFATVAA